MSGSIQSAFYEPDHRVPLVDLQLYFRTGAASDPEHLGGLCRLASSLVLCGTPALSRVEVPAAWDIRGARLSASTALSYGAMHMTCLRENVTSSTQLFSSLLQSPALRKEDLEFLKRDQHQARVARREEPQTLAARALALGIFGEHPYARGTRGSELEVARIRVEDVRSYLTGRLVQGNVVLGCSGDLRQEEAEALLANQFGWLPAGRVDDNTPEVRPPQRTAVVVEMPEQSQAHLYIGTLGAAAGDPAYDPWQLATVAFGGVFSSRLTQEIRERHGFSYEANARLFMARRRSMWRTYSFPSKKHLAECVRVQLDMIASWRELGLTDEELRDTKRYLAQSQCFDRETACKRLDPRLDEALYDLPSGWYDAEQARLRVVDNSDIRNVLVERIPDDQLCVGVAGPPGIAKIIERSFAPQHMMVLTPEAVAS